MEAISWCGGGLDGSLCCVGCDTGVSYITTRSDCQPLVDAGSAQFFPGIFTTNYPGCSANGPNGICCYKNETEQIIKHPSLVRLCDCLRIANLANAAPWSHWQIIDDCNKNINSINCTAAYNDLGACCDGLGNCQDNTSEINCNNTGFWQGKGKVCSYTVSPSGAPPQNFERCKGGTGACCTPTTCVDVPDFVACSGVGDYFGCGYTCNNPTHTCNQNPPPPPPQPQACESCPIEVTNQQGETIYRIKKYDINGNVNGTTDLRIGDYFAGGIVAGVFNPNGATCVGNSGAFSGIYAGLPLSAYSSQDLQFGTTAQNIFNQLNDGTEKQAGLYKSVYDTMGYGFTFPEASTPTHTNCDGWLLIVSPYPAMITNTLYSTDFDTPPVNPTLFACQPLRQILPDTQKTRFASIDFGVDPITSEWYYQRVINLFSWSHGGTAHCPTIPRRLESTSPNLFGGIVQTESDLSQYENSFCTQQLKSTTIYNDGQYGTLSGNGGSTYWGNATAFDGCSEIPNVCTPCSTSPVTRTRRGQPQIFTRNTGYWSRNWGLINSIRLFSSEIAHYYIKPGNGLATNNVLISVYRQLYGATGESGTDGFTAGFFFNTVPDMRNARTTAAEAISVFNASNGWTEPFIQTLPFSESFGYLQISRWYLPSIDELGFLAYQCTNPNVNLQQKILNAVDKFGASINGIPIGIDTLGATGMVWSSTGTFDEGVTFQYIQDRNGAPVIVQDQQYFGGPTPKQFTKAWAMRFPTFDILSQAPANVSDFSTKKADDLRDRYEVRPVRLIRCDQRFYDDRYNIQDVPEFIKGSVWLVPKLSPSVVCNGSAQPVNGQIGRIDSTNYITQNHIF